MRVDADLIGVRVSSYRNQVLIKRLDNFEIFLQIVLILVG